MHSSDPDLAAASRKAERALSEFRIVGAPTNIPFLRTLLRSPAFAAGEIHTRFVEEHAQALGAAALALTPAGGAKKARGPGAKLATLDPLAVLNHGKTADYAAAAPAPPDDGSTALPAPLQGTIINIAVAAGAPVRAGDTILIIESMKMEHVVAAPVDGVVRAVSVAQGDTVFEGHVLAYLEPAEIAAASKAIEEDVDLDFIRPDLAAVIDRYRGTLDAARPSAVAKRRKTGQRTARENVEDLLDPGSFIEYGSLVVAARRKRHSLEDLIRQTPADGMVMGLGRVNGKHFADDAARCAVLAYDYTVLAGTQGAYNHRKMDRLIEIAEKQRLPTVFFCREAAAAASGRHRGRRLRARIRILGPYVGGCTPRRGHFGALFRRQRFGAGMLRRDHRHTGFEHRHGWTGDDRRRRFRDL